MLSRLNEVQEATYKDLCRIVAIKNLCNMDRPCGFGKTEIFLRYVREHPWNHLYFWEVSSTEQRIANKYTGDNLYLMSYAKLFRSELEAVIEYLADKNIRTLIFDESHTIGARTVTQKWEPLIEWCVDHKIQIIGGTANVLRTDGVDVGEDLFRGCSVFKYDTTDAIADGILLPPWYIEADYTEISEEELRTLTEADKRIVIEANNPEETLQFTFDVAGTDTDYLKLIVFYNTIDEIKNSGVLFWRNCLHNMFPTHEINILPITSDSLHVRNVNRINRYVKRPRAIDVFMCVDMMNQGFHFDDLSGIVMMRKTVSPIIYTQQVGRCMSVMNQNDMFVLDMVRNFSGEFVVKNPLADVWASAINANIHVPHKSTEWSKIERYKTHVQAIQRSRMDISDKLSYNKLRAREKGFGTALKFYQRFPERDLAELANVMRVPLKDILYYIYMHGDLREEDTVPDVDDTTPGGFLYRLQRKYVENRGGSDHVQH